MTVVIAVFSQWSTLNLVLFSTISGVSYYLIYRVEKRKDTGRCCKW